MVTIISTVKMGKTSSMEMLAMITSMVEPTTTNSVVVMVMIFSTVKTVTIILMLV